MTTSVRTAAIACLLTYVLGQASIRAAQPTPADPTERPPLESESSFVIESTEPDRLITSPPPHHRLNSWDASQCWDEKGCWVESNMFDRMESWEDCSACWPEHYGPTRWTATADTLLLTRSTARSLPILFAPAAGPPPSNVIALDVDDLAFGFEVGPRVSLTRRFENECGIELNYFGVYGWSASAVRNGNPQILFPPGVFISTQFAVDYSSVISSVELNYRHRHNDRLEWLIGVRWVEMVEQFDVVGPEIVGIPTPDYSMRAGNSMYGFQIGAYSKLFDHGNRFTIDGFVKAGVLANNAYQQTVSVGNIGTIVAVRDYKDETAFLSEIGITGVYQISNRWTARFGYQVMWIDGLALAPDQISSTNTVPPVGALPGNTYAGTANLRTNGTSLYHGAHVGFEVQW
ncbi:MAG TPA: BBP7 family outer membrane beta-barrel protein [Thermoguttaceae bacterium]|nr:BBP7 family outer membrane beta-barrel protein [Thermoguttaceae bacterium]